MKKGVVGALALLIGVAGGAIATEKVLGDNVDKWQKMSDKHLSLFLMMNQWVKVKQQGKSLKDYFEKKGYSTIAIYGMSYAGETLLDELQDTGIVVKYGIDRNADRMYSDVDIITMEEELGEVDAVVVTPITFFDEIRGELEEKIHCPIISLEDVLYDC